MRKIILLTSILFGLFFIQNAYACTITDPCINLTLSSNINIGTTTNVPVGSNIIGLLASTSFDPAPTETTPCTGCYLEVQDCNSSLYECGNISLPGDWNGIPTAGTFENDLNCNANCRRSGVVEDTVFNARISGVTQASRYFRACWYDNGVQVKCSEYQRLHWYPDGTALVGTTDCRPDLGGRTLISGRGGTGASGTACSIRPALQPGTRVPLVYWLDGDLELDDSVLNLYGVSIDFNRLAGQNFKLILDTNSRLVIHTHSEDRPPWTDMNVVGIDRNTIYEWGYMPV